MKRKAYDYSNVLNDICYIISTNFILTLLRFLSISFTPIVLIMARVRLDATRFLCRYSSDIEQ